MEKWGLISDDGKDDCCIDPGIPVYNSSSRIQRWLICCIEFLYHTTIGMFVMNDDWLVKRSMVSRLAMPRRTVNWTYLAEEYIQSMRPVTIYLRLNSCVVSHYGQGPKYSPA